MWLQGTCSCWRRARRWCRPPVCQARHKIRPTPCSSQRLPQRTRSLNKFSRKCGSSRDTLKTRPGGVQYCMRGFPASRLFMGCGPAPRPHPTGMKKKANARAANGTIQLRFPGFPFPCARKAPLFFAGAARGASIGKTQSLGVHCICARHRFIAELPYGPGVFQRQIANQAPSTMSIVPQKPGHQTGMPGFVTNA